MSTFRLDGNLLHIGDTYSTGGAIEVRTLINWLADTGTLEKHGWFDEWELDRRIEDAQEDFQDQGYGELSEKVDRAVEELTYLDHEEDPYRYHDDNQHTGAVQWCEDPFCTSAGRNEYVIDILRGA